MKKRFLIALTAVMVLCMSSVAFAASSSTASSAASTNSPSGEPWAYTAPATAAYAAQSAGATTTASGSTLSVSAASESAIAVMASQTKAISPFAYALATAEYSGSIQNGGENVNLACAGIKANDTVDTIVVLHYSWAKNKMEVLKPASVSAGHVVVYLTDLSPISIIHVPAGTTVAYTNASASSNGTAATSPQTGEE